MSNEQWTRDIEETLNLIANATEAQTRIVLGSKTKQLIRNALKRLVDNVIAVEGKRNDGHRTERLSD